jgi:hypothetical protein
MSVGSVGHTVPQLQTSWTRAEAACAARRRGDVNAELEAEKPQDPAAAADGSGTSGDAASTPLKPGFTLHL